MRKTREPRSAPLLRVPTLPVIHESVHAHDYKAPANSNDGSHDNKPRNRGLTCQYAFILDSED
jgi:hypothetical protein